MDLKALGNAWDRRDVSSEEYVAALRQLEAKLAKVMEALTFYADTRRYQGANQPFREGDDPFTPPDSPFLIDTTRDGGQIARAALAAAKGE